MIVGVPKEIKRDEYRVGLLPVGAEELTRAGHHVLVEPGAGLGSGLADQDYAAMRGRTGRQPPAEILRPLRHDHQGQGAAARRGRHAAPRPDRLHLFPSRRRPAS